jgi:hypothetical protein
MSPSNRLKLGRVLAFCEALQEVNPRVTDPALWFDTPLVATSTLKPVQLYSADWLKELLDIAAERRSAQDVLDSFSPEWRSATAADDNFTVVIASDGIPSIVPRK